MLPTLIYLVWRKQAVAFDGTDEQLFPIHNLVEYFSYCLPTVHQEVGERHFFSNDRIHHIHDMIKLRFAITSHVVLPVVESIEPFIVRIVVHTGYHPNAHNRMIWHYRSIA